MRFVWLSFIICFVACGVSNRKQIQWKLPFTINQKCDIIPSEKLDQNSGKIYCEGALFSFEYQLNSYQGPLTTKEKFRYAFIGNYHNKFFEHIYIDNKLSRLYMDSVEILSILEKSTLQGHLLFECKTCNQVAILRFRKKVYNFPFFSDQALGEIMDTNFYLDTIDGHYRKIYISKTGKESGLLMEKLVGRRSAKKLAIHTSTTKDPEKILYYMKSVRIRYNDRDE